MDNGHNISSFYRADLPLKTDSYLMFYKKDEDRYIKIEISSLYDDIYNEFFNTMRFGTMAFENADDYAKIDHDHDIYTKTKYKQENGTLVVAQIDNMEIKIPVQASKTVDTSAEEILKTPNIGAIKFSSSQIKGEIDIKSSSFDGWVYADGTNYNICDFSLSDELMKIYGYEDKNYFTVPTIDKMLKFNTDLNYDGYLSKVTGFNSVGIHSHGVTITDSSFNTDECTKIQIDSGSIRTSTGGKDDSNTEVGCHASEGGIKIGLSEETDQIYQINGLETYENDTQNQDISHPSYNMMPVMVYIGYSRWSKPYQKQKD